MGLSSFSEMAQAQAYLGMARNNIERLRELSRLHGFSYCCINGLEKRQVELENALYYPVSTSGNLGLPFLVPVVVAGAMGVSAIWAYIIKQWRDTQVAIETQETYQIAMKKGFDPSSFKPRLPTSWSDELIKTIKGVIILGAVAMVLVIVSKGGLLKGVFKK